MKPTTEETFSLIQVKDEVSNEIVETSESHEPTRIPTPPFLKITDQFSLSNHFSNVKIVASLPSLPLQNLPAVPIQYERAQHRGNNLFYKGYRFYREGSNIFQKTKQLRIYWRCASVERTCRARIHTDSQLFVLTVKGEHENSCRKVSFPINCDQ